MYWFRSSARVSSYSSVRRVEQTRCELTVTSGSRGSAGLRRIYRDKLRDETLSIPLFLPSLWYSRTWSFGANLLISACQCCKMPTDGAMTLTFLLAASPQMRNMYSQGGPKSVGSRRSAAAHQPYRGDSFPESVRRLINEIPRTKDDGSTDPIA